MTRSPRYIWIILRQIQQFLRFLSGPTNTSCSNSDHRSDTFISFVLVLWTTINIVVFTCQIIPNAAHPLGISSPLSMGDHWTLSFSVVGGLRIPQARPDRVLHRGAAWHSLLHCGHSHCRQKQTCGEPALESYVCMDVNLYALRLRLKPPLEVSSRICVFN